MNLKTIPLNNLSYEELLINVSNIDNDSIILVTTYYSDSNGNIIEFENASREISKNSSVPVYHLYDMGLNNGAFGGNMLSGKLQGQRAAGLAISILEGAKPDDIPMLAPKTTRKVLDYNQLQRFNISVKEVPRDVEIINKPFSFFESYKTLVLSVMVAFITLLSFLFVLLFYNFKISRMKKNLSDSHEELTQIYEELTASEEELRQQFEELSDVQKRLSESEERFRIATEGSDAIIWDIDMSNMKCYFSDKWYELLGYEKGEIDEANGGWKTILHPDDAIEVDRAGDLHLEGKTAFYNIKYRLKTKNGQYRWFHVRGKLLQDHGKNIRFAGSMVDITERKEYQEKLQESYQKLESTNKKLKTAQAELKQQYNEILANHKRIKVTEERLTNLAYYDTLTGLPNKLSLYEDSYKTYFLPQNGQAALVFIDMDHFKYINDTMGHAFGDQLIIDVGKRLRMLLNDSCSIYRLSGDEIIIVVQNINGKEDAEIVASHILSGFNREFEVLNSVLHISLSMGIAMYPEHGDTIEELLKNADIAMYKAKEIGRKGYAVYDQLMNDAFTERAEIEKRLHKALDNNEFELHYQPQYDIKTNTITGFEALLRWENPELGSISPLKFIKVAEDTHLIIPLGTWVLRNACRFLKTLHNMGYTDLSLSVNISMLQLLQTDFSDTVVDTLELLEFKPEYLELEITESILMESFETLGLKLDQLSERGIKIALDDFGKGYSSLSYLKQLPISTLKVDKSFIDPITNESDGNYLTEHIVTIGKSLGMCVVAEGVERQEQLDYLVQHECHKIQGYLFSKPINEAETIKLLSVRN